MVSASLFVAALGNYPRSLWNAPVYLDNEESGAGVATFLRTGTALSVTISASKPVDVRVFGWAIDYALSEAEALYLSQNGVTHVSLTLRVPRDALWDVSLRNSVNSPNNVAFSVTVEDLTTSVVLVIAGSTLAIIAAGFVWKDASRKASRARPQ